METKIRFISILEIGHICLKEYFLFSNSDFGLWYNLGSFGSDYFGNKKIFKKEESEGIKIVSPNNENWN